MKTKPTTPKDLMDEVPSDKVLTYATVCSGIECMSVASWGLPLKPVFFSEIEPFPCAVLKAHYPDVPNLGDMSKIQVSNDGKEITNGTVRIVLDRPLDILAGGTPCQDVSVAGKRAGMQEGSGTRSSLAFDFVRLARELGPRYIIWENVAGAIDSKNAPDFLRFLRALGECGYSLAWRVLDAQYVRVDGMERAVPQRRRRVWVVGYSGADELIPAQILFEPDCIAGNTPPRRRTGQGFAYSLAGCDSIHAGVVDDAPGTGGGEACAPARGGQGQTVEHGSVGDEGHLGGVRHDGGGRGEAAGGVEPTVARTLERRYDSSFCADRGINVVALDGDKLKPRIDQRKGGNGGANTTEGVAPTVLSDSHGTPHGVAYAADGGEVAATITRQISEQSGQDNRANSVVQCYENHAQDSRVKPIEVSDTRNQKDGTAPGHETGVMQTLGFKAGQSANGGLGDEREVSPTLSHQSSALEPTVAIATILSQMRYIVRRLTPTECERLMGLPDGYTIPHGLLRYAHSIDGQTVFDPAVVAEFQRIFDTFGAIMHDYALASYERSHREGEPPPKPPKPKSAKQVADWLKKISDPATCPDSPRYKACGNGWATNQPRWILTRLLAADGIDPFKPQGENT